MSVPNFNHAKTVLGGAINIAPFLQQIGFNGNRPGGMYVGGGENQNQNA
jgi:hypothetical protein